MKRKTKIISAVVLSIGMVTGGAAYATYKQSYVEARAEFMTHFISNKLALNDAQVEQLNALTTQLIALKKDLKSQQQPMIEELNDLISAEQLDQDKALAIITNKTALINRAAVEVVPSFATFLDGLNASQKSQILEFLAHKSEYAKHGWK